MSLLTYNEMRSVLAEVAESIYEFCPEEDAQSVLDDLSELSDLLDEARGYDSSLEEQMIATIDASITALTDYRSIAGIEDVCDQLEQIRSQLESNQ